MNDNERDDKKKLDFRRRAESIVKKSENQSDHELTPEAPEEVQSALHELRVHQVQLELQNEELRAAEAKLEESRQRYFDLYDMAPVGYCTLSGQGIILETNLTLANLLGLSRSTLVDQAFTGFILPEDQDTHYLHKKKLLETSDPQEYEVRLRVPETERQFWGHVTARSRQSSGEAPVCRLVVSDISRRKETEEQVQALLSEKEHLVREVQHRTKNTMHTLVSILDLQTHTLGDNDEAVAVLKDMRNRFVNMELLYDQLYRTDTHKRGSLSEYLSNILERGVAMFPTGESIHVHTDIDDISLDVDRLTNLGLIVHELVTNAIKYAFAERGGGELSVSAYRNDDDHIVLVVKDDGPGMPSADDDGSPSTFGKTILQALTDQLQGTMRFENDNGVRVTLMFPA